MRGHRPAALAVALFAVLTGTAVGPAWAQKVENLTISLQTAFAARDLDSYTGNFVPGLRLREQAAVSSFLDHWKMTSVLIRRADRGPEREGDPGAYFQVFYQNEHSAVLEMWHVSLQAEDGRWLIANKEILGNITVLYKIRIPSGRAERAERVEVRHQDIRITFDNPWVFYDDIPDLTTSLIVIGRGRVLFSPSSATERHQLELRYKKPVLEDELEYAYLRFSDSFSKTNVVIDHARGTEPAPSPPQVLSNEAYALFAKYYPASFTIENSIVDGLLSFAPRGDQAVFELKTRKAGEVTYVFSPFSDDEVHFLRRDPEQVINLYTPEEPDNGGKEFFISLGEKFDVQRCDLDVNFQPETRFFSARARVTVQAQIDAVDSLRFNFNPSLDILRVSDQEGRELFHTQDKLRKLIYIYFIQPVPKGASATVEVFYRGKLDPIVQTTDVLPDGQYNDTISLLVPNYDSYLYSQSSYWYPSPPDQDFFMASLRFGVPPNYRCVATGALTQEGRIETVRGVGSLDKVGNALFTFETKYPVKYLSFIVGPFERMVGPKDKGRIPIDGYTAEVPAQRPGLLSEAQAIVDDFEKWFGPYPYEKLTVVQRLWPTSGGHSPASFIVLNELPRNPDSPLSVNPYSPVDFSRYREYYLAHEIAHQWWGQAVAGERYRDLWLSEGLAQFAAVRYLRAKFGEKFYVSTLKRFSDWTVRKSVFGPITLGSRLSYLDFDAFQAIVYDKTALVLAMLEDMLGEDTFLGGLRAFFETYKYRPARTANFIKTMEQAAGRDLQGFFRGWFDSHLLPEVRIGHEVTKAGDSFVLRFRVNQTRDVFVFPLWVTWEEDGKPVRRRLDIERPTQEFEFVMNVRPARIKINPDKLVPGDFR